MKPDFSTLGPTPVEVIRQPPIVRRINSMAFSRFLHHHIMTFDFLMKLGRQMRPEVDFNQHRQAAVLQGFLEFGPTFDLC